LIATAICVLVESCQETEG